MKYAKTKGFTIVELLMVIVVIAVLASISVVAYAGVKERAEQSHLFAEVTAWRKMLEIYKIQTGSNLALTSGSVGTICLGEHTIPADPPFAVNRCLRNGGGDYYPTDFTAMTELKRVVGTLPATTKYKSILDLTNVGWDGWNYRGIHYSWAPGASTAQIMFYLNGNKSCGPAKADYNATGNATYCTIEL